MLRTLVVLYGLLFSVGAICTGDAGASESPVYLTGAVVYDESPDLELFAELLGEFKGQYPCGFRDAVQSRIMRPGISFKRRCLAWKNISSEYMFLSRRARKFVEQSAIRANMPLTVAKRAINW